jgi:hypothetical protein
LPKVMMRYTNYCDYCVFDAGEHHKALDEYRAILNSPLHAERSWTLLAIARVHMTIAFNISSSSDAEKFSDACKVFERLMTGSWKYADRCLKSVYEVKTFINLYCPTGDEKRVANS